MRATYTLFSMTSGARLLAALFAVSLLGDAGIAQISNRAAPLPRLQVAANGRFLVRADGARVFWLGDTAWGLFEKAVGEPAADQPAVDDYFRTRAAQGFTVIQATLIKEWWKNVDGHAQFEDDRVTPRVRPGPADD